MCLDFLYNFYLREFSFKDELSDIKSKMCIGLHVRYPFILVRVSGKLNLLDSFSEKNSNIKYHENPSSGSRVVPYGKTYGRTDMTNVTVAFSSFANAPKNGCLVIRPCVQNHYYRHLFWTTNNLHFQQYVFSHWILFIFFSVYSFREFWCFADRASQYNITSLS